MRWNTFGRSVAFAALAAACLLASWAMLGPSAATRPFLSLYLVGVSAVYLYGIAPGGGGQARGRGLSVALPAGSVALVIWFFTSGLWELAVCLAILVGVCRSVFLYRARPWRAFAIEALLGCAGLALASFLAGPSVLALASALWGYLLLQSLFFLISGVEMRPAESRPEDPFEVARDRMLRVLGEEV